MELRLEQESSAIRLLPKLKSLLKKYRSLKRVQSGLLKLSELASTATDMDEFYADFETILTSFLKTDSFHIALVNNEQKLQMSFCHHLQEKNLLPLLEKNDWRESLTSIVFNTKKPLHCNKRQRETLSDCGEITLYSIDCVDWLGVPLIRNDDVIGVLALQCYQHKTTFDDNALTLLTLVAEHLVTAILRVKNQSLALASKAQLAQLVFERTKELEASNANLRRQIDERRKAEERLYFEAHHDALTKLPNRAMFSDRLTYAIQHFKRHINRSFSVLFIDLDRFKMINDTLGHHAGDLFLIEIANRLRGCVRSNDVLARLGGDEFVVLLDCFESEDDVEDVAARIIRAIEQPYDLEGNTLYSNASIGIALGGRQYKDANEVLRDADAAMYQAKSLGRGRYVFFDESMREQLLATMTLEQELRIAIKENQFELHYQKISDLNNTNTIGFEALLRWNHPSKGLLTPSEFLALAEETGIILTIETWVVEEVSRQLQEWQHSDEYCHAFIGINLSGRHLTQTNQLNKLIKLIKLHTIEPHRLILEFNESAFALHPELALKGLRTLKDFGVKLALDDYGAGLSSFNFLHSYPFEFIKLDRSFIRTLTHNSKNLSLVKALHDLGEQFGYRLVAEGIETQDVLNKLHSVGCDFGQGYHISRPGKLEKLTLEQQTKSCA